jgi:DNA repair protein RecO (recombination protein O)
MKASEAFLLHKIEYGEADYILSLFTKDFGKIRGLAKNAKKSRKRFGGRLEPFVHLRVRFREKPGGIKFIEDCETIRVFSTLMQDIQLFLYGSFVLENVDILLPEEDSNEKIFNLLAETFSALDSKKNPSNAILKFQLSILSLSGYEPNLHACVWCKRVIEEDSYFDIKQGGIVCNKCKKDKTNGFIISKGFLLTTRNWIEGQPNAQIHELKEALHYIELFVQFTQYRTGKEMKSFKFLEELRND